MTNDQGHEGGRIIGPLCLIPSGKYEVAYSYYETGIYWGQPKVVVHFSVINHDTFAGTEVDRFYNASSLEGPPRRYGGFSAVGRGDLYREYSRLKNETVRRDRISYSFLKGKRVLAQIEPVTLNYQRQPLASDEQYSRITKLIGILDDDY